MGPPAAVQGEPDLEDVQANVAVVVDVWVEALAVKCHRRRRVGIAWREPQADLEPEPLVHLRGRGRVACAQGGASTSAVA